MYNQGEGFIRYGAVRYLILVIVTWTFIIATKESPLPRIKKRKFKESDKSLKHELGINLNIVSLACVLLALW